MVGIPCPYPPIELSAVIPENVPLQLHTAIYTAEDLKSDQGLVHDLVNLINAGFYRPAHFSGNRFDDYGGLCETLGSDGLCAVMWEELKDDEICRKDEVDNVGTECVLGAKLQNGTKRIAVASASAKPKATDNEFGNNFEVFAVVSYNAPRYRRKGLAEQCQRLLEAELVNRLSTPSQIQQGLNIWLYVAEEINGKYWRGKGGYEIISSGPAPNGLWTSIREFTLTTMRKNIKVSGSSTPDEQSEIQVVAV
ncbi:hypothetical protein L228DRAFT_266344 [Xylona heveae TC161]|uniref:N-acetyltransferase domain-containing protein n=1 Tax=Xylona heveae (strain CBS 132557 / TC161) TaxID=1328760 RepID=A0A165HVB2_XYLHT|nr:hypothetical protein L228DRAFT_266344 [Xylona heveae TC161]KZF23971.1 hypothetical protein L228DRAFT_266344 [Xylona heveae TC161]